MLLQTTLLSRETIKPSSPTPLHLRTFNFSLIEHTAIGVYAPMVFFYPPSTDTSKTRDRIWHLKTSLSQTLTKYYPFAGTLISSGVPHIECNDEGAEFLEAHVDVQLSDFLRIFDFEAVKQLFPPGQAYGSHGSTSITSLVVVQISHFQCGGISVGVAMSHKIVDGCTMCYFIKYWADMARRSSGHTEQLLPRNPQFILYPSSNDTLPEVVFDKGRNSITKRFVFPNSKVLELKLKIAKGFASSHLTGNPTRVEVITTQLVKCMAAATNRTTSGAFKPCGLGFAVNMRSQMIEALPENAAGNINTCFIVPIKDESEMDLVKLTAGLKESKAQLRSIRDYKEMGESLKSLGAEGIRNILDGVFLCSSLCNFPIYAVDFGWGKPVQVTIAGAPRKNMFFLLDAPSGDGIEALVTLEKEDMAIFEKNQELLELMSCEKQDVGAFQEPKPTVSFLHSRL